MDRVIYDLEDEDGTTTEGVVLAGVSGGSGQIGRADWNVDRSCGKAVVDTEEQPEQLGTCCEEWALTGCLVVKDFVDSCFAGRPKMDKA